MNALREAQALRSTGAPYSEHPEWSIVDASGLTADATLDCDVAIVGTGAGGGTAAEVLAQAGLRVVLIEEGPLKTSHDFHMRESDAYPQLYQESAARKTADKAINILQGRCVGGGTTVNWTSSFRTPPATLGQWASVHGIRGLAVDDLAPWFERMEAHLSIAPWTVPPNANNSALARGADALKLHHNVIARNVHGCLNLGYCGMGCPVNAKQSMLVTSVPAALAHGATLVTRARAQQLVLAGDKVRELRCVALDADGTTPLAHRLDVIARVFVVSAGAIGSPALLLRSGVPDPHELIGKRTFLHPTVVSAALMPERIDPYAGAPQSVYSDAYLQATLDGPIGFKLEAPPVHPVLAAITLPSQGEAHAQWMKALPNMHVLIALLRDGFHADSGGGRVRLRDDTTPVLDYPFTPYLWDGARRAFAAMADLQFAAGARRVMPMHADGSSFGSAPEAREAIGHFDLRPLATTVVSAHVMGGCPIGSDVRSSVVDAAARHHHVANLHVLDGSLFPTSIGANPQLSIYAIVAKLATGLADALRR